MTWDKFEKLVELVKRRVTQVVLYKMKDPRLGFITITKVDLARDLKTCKVFYTVLGAPGGETKTQFALKDAAGFIQREVGKALRTRTRPSIEFVVDPTAEKVQRVHEILDSLRQETGAPSDEAGSNPDDEAGAPSDEEAASIPDGENGPIPDEEDAAPCEEAEEE